MSLIVRPGRHRCEGRDGRVVRTDRPLSMEQTDVVLAIFDRSEVTPSTATFIEADEHGWSVHRTDGAVVVAWEGDEGEWAVVEAHDGRIEQVAP